MTLTGGSRASAAAKEEVERCACGLASLLGLDHPSQEGGRRSGPAQLGELGLATCWAKSRESERGEVLSFCFYFPEFSNGFAKVI